ncbi:magnetosome protein MamC [Terasakiella sp. SH-1]|uniref:magnetosome protein MamC n=1 Tax=Terasakiella sp. SH-1 TaxID=2560057 RepID=UPI001073D92A|nr:magnetosome protein MamC [Terasakiella sp. SH-1]
MAFQLAPYLAQSVPGVGALGAIVGGSGALAKNLQKHKAGEMDTNEVVVDTAKEAAGAGVATAVSAFTVGVVGGGLAVSVGTAFVAAVAGKYVWDRGMEYIEGDKDFAPILDEEALK